MYEKVAQCIISEQYFHFDSRSDTNITIMKRFIFRAKSSLPVIPAWCVCKTKYCADSLNDQTTIFDGMVWNMAEEQQSSTSDLQLLRVENLVALTLSSKSLSPFLHPLITIISIQSNI